MATKLAPVAEDYEEPGDTEAKVLEKAKALIGRLNSLASEQIRRKAMVEQRWLADLGNYQGVYDPTTLKSLKALERSLVFVKLTRHKTNAWSARLSDLLFPTDDKNWGIQPTPLPKLAQVSKDAVAKAIAATETANAAQDPQQQERIKQQADAFAQKARQTQAEIEAAKKRCSAMQDAIEDQLVECDYIAQCRDVIEDGCKLGTGILKGPMTSQRLRAEWRQQDGVWELAQIPDPMPEFRRVDPWHFFPDMSARTIREAEFTFERHLPTKRDLKQMAKKLGFNVEAVTRLLDQGPQPIGTEVQHLALLRGMTGEDSQITDRFVMWEYHGSLECDEIASLLRAAGKTQAADRFEAEKDPLEEYRVIIHFCNDEVLKIAPEYPLDSGDSLYSVWNFEKGETSVFGLGIPNIMADSQAAVNGAWRMMMDNAGLSVGPQVVINKAAIAPQPGEGWGIKPMKVWLQTTTAGTTPQNPPFQVYNIPINQQQIAGIIETAKAFIDEETSMPMIAQGEQGAASQTMGGMSMLFNSANVVFRRVIKSWDDDLTKPTLRRAYDWNMQFNPDENIKGDMQVDARGTSVLLVKEIQSQTLMQIMTNWTTHPVLGPWIKVRSGIEKTVQTLMVSPADLLKTQEEFDTEQAAQAAQQAQQQPEQDQAGQAAVQAAQLRLQAIQAQIESNEKIADQAAQVKMMEISERSGLTRDELQHKYGIEKLRTDSKERIEATKIAVEDQRAQDAQAHGEPVAEAVGQGVG